MLFPPLTFLMPAKKETLQSSGIALIEMTANLSSGLGLVSGTSESKVDVGFDVGMQVCVWEEVVFRDGKVTSKSANDGVTVRYVVSRLGRFEESYTPTKLKKMIADGVAEKAAREKAAREKAAREKAAREKAAREKKCI